ncbi:7694_t:CDS:2 [Dentiscutata heterogama]|uniref:7694_t:CDS:1 n=1 Tax=Dentiscutata heterogama TaxID=1316150 RepID=A0ACA9K5V2_9GLOM|nr:7694_t:CDS:2 [Dentiscutata heterogama]
MTFIYAEDNAKSTAPDMLALGEAMTTTIKRFSSCKKIRVKNNEISKMLEEINQQRLKFRDFASDSVKQSSKLARFAEEVVIFAECCNDAEFSKDDLLNMLRLRLSDARKNKENSEILQLKIRHIRDDLTDVTDKLVQYATDIKNCHRIIDSDVGKKLSEKEATQEKYNASSKANIALAILGALTALAASPFTGGTTALAAVCTSVFDAGIFTATAGTAIAGGTKLLAHSEGAAIDSLNKKLLSERDHLTNSIETLNNDLILIIKTCRKFITFWEEQIDAINSIIEKLEPLNNQEALRNVKLIAYGLLKTWKNVNSHCKEYNRIMYAELDNDALLRNAVTISASFW